MEKLPANLRGKYVTRAAFAKLQGEKNRLMNDIYTLTMGSAKEGWPVMEKWVKKFKQDRLLNTVLQEIAKTELHGK